MRQQKAKQDQDDIERERLAEAARQAERVVVLQPSTACTWLQEAPAKGQTFDVVVKRGKETKEVFVQTAGFKSKSLTMYQTPRGLNEDVVVGARVWIQHLQLEMTVSVPGYELWTGKKALSVILTNTECDTWLMSRLKGLALMGDFVRSIMLRRICVCVVCLCDLSMVRTRVYLQVTAEELTKLEGATVALISGTSTVVVRHANHLPAVATAKVHHAPAQRAPSARAASARLIKEAQEEADAAEAEKAELDRRENEIVARDTARKARHAETMRQRRAALDAAQAAEPEEIDEDVQPPPPKKTKASSKPSKPATSTGQAAQGLTMAGLEQALQKFGTLVDSKIAALAAPNVPAAGNGASDLSLAGLGLGGLDLAGQGGTRARVMQALDFESELQRERQQSAFRERLLRSLMP